MSRVSPPSVVPFLDKVNRRASFDDIFGLGIRLRVRGSSLGEFVCECICVRRAGSVPCSYDNLT